MRHDARGFAFPAAGVLRGVSLGARSLAEILSAVAGFRGNGSAKRPLEAARGPGLASERRPRGRDLAVAGQAEVRGSGPSMQHRLDQLASGARVVVRRIEGSDAAMSRLMAMGLCVGREIEVVRRGNPLVIRLLGARVGLSGRLARRIIVEWREP